MTKIKRKIRRTKTVVSGGIAETRIGLGRIVRVEIEMIGHDYEVVTGIATVIRAGIGITMIEIIEDAEVEVIHLVAEEDGVAAVHFQGLVPVHDLVLGREELKNP
jgi:hypothetical protein